MNHRPRENRPGRKIVISGRYYFKKHNVATMQRCIMKIFQTILLIISMENYKADAKMIMVYSLACLNTQKVLGKAHCLACKFCKFSVTRELFYYVAKHFGALPSRLLAALAKQNKRFVSSRKHVERTTTWRKKKRYPLHNSF